MKKEEHPAAKFNGEKEQFYKAENSKSGSGWKFHENCRQRLRKVCV